MSTDSSHESIDIRQLQEVNQVLLKVDLLLGNGDNLNDYFPTIAQVLIPIIADWCSIHLVKDDGSIERIAFAPEQILKDQAVYEWFENDLLNDETDGLPDVLSTGKTKFISEVNQIRRAAAAGIKSYLIVPLSIHEHVFGAITFVRAESGQPYHDDSAVLAENLAIHLSRYLEKSQRNSDHISDNEELEPRYSEGTTELQEAMLHLRQSEEMIQTLFRISNKLNATLNLDQILDELAQEAIQMVNGESGFAGLRISDGMTVKKYFHHGVVVPFEHTWALGEGIPGWVLKYKVPYGTSDGENDPLIRRELAINKDVRSIICTPILDTVGEVIAYFDIRNKRDAEGFSISDQEMLLTLAPVASIAIQNALAYQKRLETVSQLEESIRQYQELGANIELDREEQRTQIARELHDQLGQSLTAIKFDLAWLGRQLSEKDETLSQKTIDISSQVNAAIKTVRRISEELRPGMLENFGLAASIDWLAHDFEKRSGIICTVHSSEEEFNLTDDQSLAIYRIFQEALTNIMRYAQAKHVEGTLSKSGNLLTLEITDDGRGIKADEISNSHSFGILGMRERAIQLGGTFDIYATPDQGTTIKVVMPIVNVHMIDNEEERHAQNSIS